MTRYFDNCVIVRKNAKIAGSVDHDRIGEALKESWW